MPSRWHCEHGHHIECAAEHPPVSCPVCASRVLSRADALPPAADQISAGVSGADVGATLERPVAPSSKLPQPGKTSPLKARPASGPAKKPAGAPPADAASDATLARPGPAPVATQPISPVQVPATGPQQDTIDQPVGVTPPLGAIQTHNKNASATELADALNRTKDFDSSSRRSSALPTYQAEPEDDYEMLQLLGRGGMGVVYKARQVQLNRLVALKMILAGAHASPEEMHRFESEAKAVAQLQHPNIVQIFDVGRREGRPFFALEFVDGGSLGDKMKGAPMPPRGAAEIALQLAAAIHFAHDKGIIHRDLKPANILMTSEGAPKITDFGLAKRFKEDDSQTHTGTVLGTPSYMSPEQAQGLTRDIGPLADVYSLGAIFYEMLTGRPPFRGHSVMDTLNQVQHNEPVAPRRLQPGVPADLETICLKCLRKEPEKRYASAQALAEDLRRYLNNEPIQARPVGIEERVYKWARRHPTVAALLALLVLVIVGGFFGMMTLWLQAEGALEAETLAKKDADAQKIAALAAEEKAKKEHLAALAAEAKVKENFHKLRRQAYIGGMDLAQRALKDGYQKRALELLEKLKLHKNEEPDLRGFEWFYLHRLCVAKQQSSAGHVQRVTHMAFNADSTLLATASLDQSIKVWDVAAEKELFPAALVGHVNPIRALAFNDAGTMLASGSSDGVAFLWQVNQDEKSGKLLGSFTAHPRAVLGLAFSPDGKRMATASEDRTVRVWHIANVLSAAGGAAPAPALTLQGHKYAVTCLDFSPKKNLLASGSEDKTVKVWDLQTGTEMHTYKGHTHWISCLDFSADARWLASGSWDRTVRLWDVAGVKPPRIVQEHLRPVQALSFNPDGSKLAGMSSQGVVRIWEMISQKEKQPLEPMPGLIRTVSFSSDGQSLASVGFLNPLFDPSATFTAHNSVVTAVAVVPGSKSAVSASSAFDSKQGFTQGEVLVWNALDRKVKHHWHAQTGLIRSLTVSDDGKLLAAGSEDHSVAVLDLSTGQVVLTLADPDERVLSVVFCPKTHLLAAADEAGWIWVWDVDTKRVIKGWKAHPAAVRQLAFHPDGGLLASAGDDKKVNLWLFPPTPDTKRDAAAVPTRSYSGHTAAVLCVCFSKDGKHVISGGEDQKILIRAMDTNQLVHELTGHTDSVTCLTCSPDGKRLASGSLDHTIKLWDPVAGQEVFTLYGHNNGITSLAFTPAADLLLSSSLDRTVRIWDGRE